MAKPKGLNPDAGTDQAAPTRHALDVMQEQQPKQAEQAKEAKPKYSKPRKQAVTVHISPELVEQARNAVYWTPGLTFAELAERGIRGEIEALQAKRGEPFPQREGELPTGRPVR